MPGSSLESFGGGAMSKVKRLSLTQQLMMGGAFIALVGLVLFASRLGGSTSMGILYSDLEPEVAASIVDQLESQGVPYELSDSGRVIWVPRQLVSATRLDMSAAGLPESAGGWSILDNQGITSSAFDQRVGYQRAMEDELAKTIASIDGVASADVHLVIPEKDLFVADDIKSSASVLLLMDGANTVSPEQVQAVVNLVASSVEGLTTANVTVTDGTGQLLAGGDSEGLLGMESANQSRMAKAFEADVQQQIVGLLEAVVGPGRAVVTVEAELDFDAVVITEEKHSEPVNAAGQTLPQQETTRNEQYSNPNGTDAGTLNIETQVLNGVPAQGADGSLYTLNERDVAYALDRVVTSTERAPGNIRRLSVAVVIDDAVADAAQLPELERVVTAAVGADVTRGDSVAVSLLPFEVTPEEEEAAQAEAAAVAAKAGGSDLMSLIRTVGSILVALMVLILGLLMLRKGTRRTIVDSIDVASLPDALGTGDAVDPITGRALGVGERTGSPPATEEELTALIANQPEDIAAVLRQWLTQPEASR